MYFIMFKTAPRSTLIMVPYMLPYGWPFARAGNPNSEGAPTWPKYGATAQFQSLVSPVPSPPKESTESDSSFDADHKCSSFWDTF
jgi:hypothetical protein